MSEARSHGPWHDLLSSTGEMGTLVRDKDWSTTPLGALERWSPTLRNAVVTCLGSRFPMCVYWGPDLLQIYNEGFRGILGNKHPVALGDRASNTWGEIWPAIGSLFRGVWDTGVPHWGEDFVLFMERKGYLEETAFTFSYSPIRNENAEVVGLLNTAIETTGRMLTERRMRSLRHLAYAAAKVHTLDEAYKVVPEALENANPDLPFTLHYEVLPRAEVALLKGSSGFPGGMASSGFPSAISLQESEDGSFAKTLRRALSTNEREQADDDTLSWRTPVSAADVKASRAQIWPVYRSGEGHISILVVGLNPHRALDVDYVGFIDLVADHVGTALRNATTFETETKRSVALAELDRSKTEFFSNVSHEFRTPLTLILGPLEELLSSRRGPINPEQRHELELLKRNSLRLLKLVNTLLDFSRVEAGGIEARLEPTDLAQLTRDLSSVFAAAFEKAGLAFKTEFPSGLRPVRVDAELWEKIILNLLSNALKFTRSGTVTLSLAEEGEFAVLRVSDTGMGIPPAEVPHVFDRFHQVREHDSRSFEGSGIGLALVKDLVHLMSGTVEVVSERDVGTTFTVHLPIAISGPARVVSPPVGASTTAAAFAQEAEGWLSSPPPVQSQQERPAGCQERARILWVDDSADMRDYVTRLLSDRWEVMLAADAQTALRMAQEDPPGLILADRMMPGLDGLALIQELRRDERTRTIPVILLSARERDDLPIEELEADPDDYILKPFKASELIARISTHLRLAKLRRDSEEALRKSQEQFLNAQKMEAIGRLAGGVAHDFNNMLTAINGYGDLIYSQTTEGSPIHDYALEIRKAGERAAALTSQLLAYSRRQLLVPRVLDTRAVLEEMSNWLRKLVPENVRITQRFADPSGHVKLDRSQFEQIVLNLVVNARDAMPGGGRMEIATEVTQWQGENALTEPAWLAPPHGTYVRLSVEDTGYGMGPEITAHLFEPFFTTKEVGRGSGLGLSAVYGIVKQAGGAISLKTEPRKGSRFSIYLPLVEPEAPVVPAAPRVVQAGPAGKGTILLVEDEEVVRRLAKTILQKAGYEVLEAARPDEAVRIHEEINRPIDLLLTDMIMPGMNGRELALHLSAMRPDMEVLIMSGYTDDQLLRSGISANSTAFLAKPFDPRQLLDKVAEVLRTRAAREE